MRPNGPLSLAPLLGLIVLVGTLSIAFGGNAQPRMAGALLDNNRVTVSRVTWDPGKSEPMHKLPADVIVIQATPGDLDLTIGDVKTTGHQEVGKTWYMPKELDHAVKNTGTQSFDWILVRLK